MFELWRLRRARSKLQRQHRRETAKLREEKASHEDFESLEFSLWSDMKEYDYEIETTLSRLTIEEAERYDVALPARMEDGMWMRTQIGPSEFVYWLSSQGRSHVRTLIHEEKARRFEARTRWVTGLIFPLLAALVGIIAAHSRDWWPSCATSPNHPLLLALPGRVLEL
ncbi:MAG: hypothetical protein DMG37_11450 [Acidobacteria bacterium]|nr:MAG: hypothetical protein DMG37_11450 [Acidobacteriota bacterium]